MANSKKHSDEQQIPPNYRRLEGSERHARKGAHRVGPADPHEKISITICVRRRPGGPALPDHEYWMKNRPGNRKYLSREKFATDHGASQKELDAVANFARSHGLEVSETNVSRRTVTASGTVAQMSKAFAVELGRYEAPDEKYRGREGFIHLPLDVADLVEGVFGLDNRRMARRAMGFNAAGSLTPIQVAQYYNFPTTSAAGQTIGVLEFSDPVIGTCGYDPNDIKSYFTTNNGIGPGFVTPALQDVPINGASNQPGGLGDTEVIIDICVAAAVAQGANVAVYFATWDENGWVMAVKAAAHPNAALGQPSPSVVSISWGWGEFQTAGNLDWTASAMNQLSATFQDAATFGVTFFVASGDSGSDCQLGDGSAHVYYPASDPWITCCGGTEIGSDNGAYAEVTWPDTGGGISDNFALPAWQAAAGIPLSVNPGQHQGRGIPDIAGYSNGYSIVQGGSSQGPFPGTSETAPLYAGLIAVINAAINQRVGFLNPTIYELALPLGATGILRDINDGTSNAQNGAPGYTSGKGWDACTGWGVMDGGGLLAAIQDLYTKHIVFTLDRDHYGQDEIDGLRTQPGGAVVSGAFFVFVDGFTPAELGITDSTSLSVAPVVTLSPSTGITVRCSSLESDDPSYGPEVQRFRFGYDVDFGADDSAFNFTTPTKTVTLSTMYQGLTGGSQITLMKQPDPYIQQGPQTWWLSNDIRLIQVATGDYVFGVQMGTDPFAFLQQLTQALESAGTVAANAYFDVDTDEDSEVISIAPQNSSGANVYNFALARVHYEGLMLEATNVRVFFRLFAANSTATYFEPTSTYERYPATYPVPAADYGEHTIPTPGVIAGEYVSIPCFGTPRQNALQSGSSNSLPLSQFDALNVRTLEPTGGALHDTYFGCFLDINQTTPVLPATPPAGNEDGPWPSGVTVLPLQQAFIKNEHQCLVAEIAFDPDPIGTGVAPYNSDKFAQRNISWSTAANPGVDLSRGALETFEVRPTPASLGIHDTPDEIMIDWNNVPAGQTAEVYLPAVSADKVLSMAAEMYLVHRLSRVDAHTIGCETGAVSYIPLPKGSGGGANFAGLMTVSLPKGIKKGQKYSVLVRQLTNDSARIALPPPPPPPPPVIQVRTHDAAAIAPRIYNPPPVVKWRRVLGTFQINIPVSTKELMLPKEEQRLSIFRWIMEGIPVHSRWYPVMKRYLEKLAIRVTETGGDPTRVLPSSNGNWQHPGQPIGTHHHHHHHAHHHGEGHREEFTGKVTGVAYDRFGDFEGFRLETEHGRELCFRHREREIEELVHRAWRDRTVITVVVERHDPHWPVTIVLRRPATIRD